MSLVKNMKTTIISQSNATIVRNLATKKYCKLKEKYVKFVKEKEKDNEESKTFFVVILLKNVFKMFDIWTMGTVII